jgi:hypothetical protein
MSRKLFWPDIVTDCEGTMGDNGFISDRGLEMRASGDDCLVERYRLLQSHAKHCCMFRGPPAATTHSTSTISFANFNCTSVFQEHDVFSMPS